MILLETSNSHSFNFDLHSQDLEWREKQYDVRQHVPIFRVEADDVPLIDSALLYIASSNRDTNADYLGPASQEDIAQQISRAHGPSGPNSEYLFRLVEAIRKVLVLLHTLY